MLERREFPRFRILSDVILTPGSFQTTKKPVSYCVGYDISQGGMGIVSMETFVMNKEYTLTIKKIPQKLTGKLVSEGKLVSMPGVKKYGIQFYRVLSVIELEEILKVVGKNQPQRQNDGKAEKETFGVT